MSSFPADRCASPGSVPSGSGMGREAVDRMLTADQQHLSAAMYRQFMDETKRRVEEARRAADPDCRPG